MKRLGMALLLGLLLAACSSETAIVATLDLQGGAGSSFGGSSGSGAGGVAGAQQVTSGGARQESGGAPIQSGGISGGSDVASVGGFGGTAGGAQFAAGGAQSGGASGGTTLDAGAGGVLTGDVPPMYCSCAESHTVCGSDGETHLCIGNQCPAIMIICDHECPCGAGETSVGGERGLWYPEECFDPGTCADTGYFCASNAPDGAAVLTDCATLQP